MLSLLKHWYQRHFSQPGTIEFAVVLIATFITVYYFMWLVGPLVVALCLAFCLDWPVEKLKRRFGIGRKIGSCIVMTIFSSFFITICVLVAPNVIKQGAELYNSIVSFSTVDPEKQAVYDQQSFTGSILSGSENKTNAVDDKTQSLAQSMADDPAQSMADDPAQTAHESTLNAQVNTSQESNNSENKDVSNAKEDTAHSTPQVTPDTTIIYISNTEQDGAKHVASAHGTKVQSHQNTAANSTHTYTNPDGYQFKVINGANNTHSLGTVTSSDGQINLTVNDFDIRVAHELNEVLNNLPEPMPSMLTIATLEEYVSRIRVAATNKIADLMRTQLMPSVVNAFTWLVYAIIVPIFTFLMLYNKRQLQKRALTFILPNNQQLMRQFWPSMQAQISGYIRGKILHIVIIAAANSVAFMLMGMNYALLLGVGVGLSVVIPYVGAVVIAVPVVMVAVFQFGFSPELLWVLVIYTVIQLLDSNVLTPMLFSKAMNLDAFSILSAILIFGNLWGFWGVFFAIPLATFVKTLITGWPNNDPHDEFGNPQKAEDAAQEAVLTLREIGIKNIEKNFSEPDKSNDKDRI